VGSSQAADPVACRKYTEGRSSGTIEQDGPGVPWQPTSTYPIPGSGREEGGLAAAGDVPSRNRPTRAACANESKNRFFEDDVERELKASFTAKRARIGAGQGRIHDYITHNRGNRPYVSQQDLQKDLKEIQTDMYY
jgi:hypothetical protein